MPDDVYERVRTQFSEPEIVALTFAAVAINGWNRLATAFGAPAGGLPVWVDVAVPGAALLLVAVAAVVPALRAGRLR